MNNPPTIDEYRRRLATPVGRCGGQRARAKADSNAPLPAISVVTVVLNRKATLDRAIQSVLSQNVPGVEHIVIDGGSTDGTLDVIESHDSQLAYWLSEKDDGIFDAMNKGIALAQGRYISLLNSDDYYLPGSLAQVVQRIQKESADIIFGDYIFNVIDLDMEARIRTSHSMATGMTLGHAIFVSKEVYARIGLYDSDYTLAGDLEFAIRARNAGVKFLKIDAPLQNFSSGGAAELNLFTASLQATRIMFRGAGFAHGLLYGLRSIKRIVLRTMQRAIGRVFGQHAGQYVRRKYYAMCGYTLSGNSERA